MAEQPKNDKQGSYGEDSPKPVPGESGSGGTGGTEEYPRIKTRRIFRRREIR